MDINYCDISNNGSNLERIEIDSCKGYLSNFDNTSDPKTNLGENHDQDIIRTRRVSRMAVPWDHFEESAYYYINEEGHLPQFEGKSFIEASSGVSIYPADYALVKVEPNAAASVKQQTKELNIKHLSNLPCDLPSTNSCVKSPENVLESFEDADCITPMRKKRKAIAKVMGFVERNKHFILDQIASSSRPRNKKRKDSIKKEAKKGHDREKSSEGGGTLLERFQYLTDHPLTKSDETVGTTEASSTVSPLEADAIDDMDDVRMVQDFDTDSAQNKSLGSLGDGSSEKKKVDSFHSHLSTMPKTASTH